MKDYPAIIIMIGYLVFCSVIIDTKIDRNHKELKEVLINSVQECVIRADEAGERTDELWKEVF